jgi:hypothetical protein
MTRRVLLAVIALATSAAVSAGDSFPTANASYFADGVLDRRHEKQLVAIEGRITRVEKGPQDKPLFELSLGGPGMHTVWVGSLVVASERTLKQGDSVRVLGYLQQVAPDDTWAKAVTADAHYVLGFCFVNLNTKQGLYLPAGLKQCEGWQAGRTPEELSK